MCGSVNVYEVPAIAVTILMTPSEANITTQSPSWTARTNLNAGNRQIVPYTADVIVVIIRRNAKERAALLEVVGWEVIGME